MHIPWKGNPYVVSNREAYSCTTNSEIWSLHHAGYSDDHARRVRVVSLHLGGFSNEFSWRLISADANNTPQLFVLEIKWRLRIQDAETLRMSLCRRAISPDSRLLIKLVPTTTKRSEARIVRLTLGMYYIYIYIYIFLATSVLTSHLLQNKYHMVNGRFHHWFIGPWIGYDLLKNKWSTDLNQ